MTNNELLAAWKAYRDQHGHAKAREILETVAGVTAISEVPDGKVRAAVTAFTAGARTRSPGGKAVLNPAEIWAKWNGVES